MSRPSRATAGRLRCCTRSSAPWRSCKAGSECRRPRRRLCCWRWTSPRFPGSGCTRSPKVARTSLPAWQPRRPRCRHCPPPCHGCAGNGRLAGLSGVRRRVLRPVEHHLARTRDLQRRCQTKAVASDVTCELCPLGHELCDGLLDVITPEREILSHPSPASTCDRPRTSRKNVRAASASSAYTKAVSYTHLRAHE